MKLLEETRAPLGSRRIRADALEVGEIVFCGTRGSARVETVLATDGGVFLRLRCGSDLSRVHCPPLFRVEPDTRFVILAKQIADTGEE